MFKMTYLPYFTMYQGLDAHVSKQKTVWIYFSCGDVGMQIHFILMFKIVLPFTEKTNVINDYNITIIQVFQ